jgi:sugar phosphate isomerase/epimerase
MHGQLVLGNHTLLTCTDYRLRVEAARLAGFNGIGLRPQHRRQALDAGMTDADQRQLLAQAGIKVVELQTLVQWGRDTAEAEAELYELADATGGSVLVLHPSPGTGALSGPGAIRQAARKVRDICERAADHDLMVGIEFHPCFEVSHLATAAELVERSAAENAGIVLDSWHFFRGGAANRETLEATAPELIVSVQLVDGDTELVGPLFEEKVHRSRLPGRGDFDLAGLLAVLEKIGVRAPLVAEVWSDELAEVSHLERARLCGQAMREVLQAASARTGWRRG